MTDCCADGMVVTRVGLRTSNMAVKTVVWTTEQMAVNRFLTRWLVGWLMTGLRWWLS